MKTIGAALPLLAVLGMGSPALAQQVIPDQTTHVLATSLTGPAIDGIVPGGKAEYTEFEGTTNLVVGGSNLNLPDGTVLDIALNGQTVGSVSVFGGNTFALPSDSQIHAHAGETITLTVASTGGGVIILAPDVGTVVETGTFEPL
jgi:hypothetical protein